MGIELYPPMNRGRATVRIIHIIVGTQTPVIINSWGDIGRCTSQYFGENRAEYYKQWGMKGHNGHDITLFHGDDIIASHDGEVFEVSTSLSAGLGVVLWNKEGRFKTVYWHLKVGSFLVSKGDQVRRGEKIAEGNNTGYSTGDHLHYALKQTDEKGRTINTNNGYQGAIDDTPYRVDETMLLDWNNKIWLIVEGKRFWVLDPKSVEAMGGYEKVRREDASQYPYNGAFVIAETDEPK